MADEVSAMSGGKRNKWLVHLKKTMRAHKGKSLGAVMKMAKKTYKGGASLSPLPLSGGRRRRGTKKGSRKGGRGYY
jgi:hypothetical protein